MVSSLLQRQLAHVPIHFPGLMFSTLALWTQSGYWHVTLIFCRELYPSGAPEQRTREVSKLVSCFTYKVAPRNEGAAKSMTDESFGRD